MFKELGLLVDLWLYHVVCIFAMLCLCYAAHRVCSSNQQHELAILKSKRVHLGTTETTNL
ncbi:ORF7a protein [Simian hemorrhagic encephalitis virus]|uniref:ORF7a protein n=1 Tax=Simian hemorrhagic encephalitis virus TaxID=1965068 RepID=A0A0F6PU80_9NIDO|nr:ORF7a protein [Simian hemorrhagic encephalitis virus]AKC89300.1 ORF7a protein [Simian hemorrhagic encephalitis virus]